MTATNKEMLNWLLQFYTASKQTFWMGTTYNSVDECLEAIKVYYANNKSELQADYASYQC